MKQVLVVNESSVAGHALDSGAELWSVPFDGGSSSNASNSQPVALPGDRVFVSKGYAIGCMLLHISQVGGKWQAEVEWKDNKLMKTKFTNVVIVGDYAYGLSDGVLECIQWPEGERQWKQGRYGHGQILLVGDVLLVQAEAGELLMVEATPDEHRELAKLPALSDKTWNNLCLYGDKLLLRNAAEAVCYELPLK